MVALTHVSAGTARLTPPLDSSYTIVNNNDDHAAKLVSPTSTVEMICYNVFKMKKMGHLIPAALADDRVGMSLSPSPTGRPSEMLMLQDEGQENGAEATPVTGGPAPSTLPAGSPFMPAFRPPAKRLKK